MSQKGRIINHLSDISAKTNKSSLGYADSALNYSEFSLSSAEPSLKGTLLEFGAENCISCRRMKASLKEIREKYRGRISVQVFNITETEGLQMGRKFGMVMIPMQVLLNRNGEVVYKHAGFITAAELSQKIDQKIHLY